MFGAHALAMLPWAVVLSGLALFLAWRAYRHDQYALMVRRFGWAALVWSVWLVGLMRLVVRIGGAVADWAAGFVLRPSVWLGIIVGAVAVLLIVAGTFIRRRTASNAPGAAGSNAAGAAGQRPAVQGSAASPSPRSQPAATDAADDDLADIEAILRKHGIE